MPADFGSYKVGNQTIALTPAIIKSAICPTLSEIEILNFGFMCQQNDLNPFVREAYAVKYGNSPASLIIAKQGLANRAERSGHLKSKVGGIIQARKAPDSESEYITKEVKGSFVEPGWILVGGWAMVTRDDRSEPYEERVSFNEYNNSSNPLWKTKPATMIAKVAMQHCLREAFPLSQMAGAYFEEEFGDDLNPSKHNKPAPVHRDFDDIEDADIAGEASTDTDNGENNPE